MFWMGFFGFNFQDCTLLRKAYLFFSCNTKMRRSGIVGFDIFAQEQLMRTKRAVVHRSRKRNTIFTFSVKRFFLELAECFWHQIALILACNQFSLYSTASKHFSHNFYLAAKEIQSTLSIYDK